MVFLALDDDSQLSIVVAAFAVRVVVDYLGRLPSMGKLLATLDTCSARNREGNNDKQKKKGFIFTNSSIFIAIYQLLSTKKCSECSIYTH